MSRHRSSAPPGVATVQELATWSPRLAEGEITSWVGMVVFLAGWTMLFGGLFVAYGLLRSRAPAWPPPDLPAPPRLLPALATLLLAVSSLAADRGLRGAGPVVRRAAARSLGAALGLGAAVLVLQLALLAQLWRSGLTPSGGPYPSVLLGLTGVHALHVGVGVGGLAFVVARAVGAGATRACVRLWAAYWHFVGVVWLALFLVVYLA